MTSCSVLRRQRLGSGLELRRPATRAEARRRILQRSRGCASSRPDPFGRCRVLRSMVSPAPAAPSLAREIGLFGATMLVMGGIVGSGIFMNPYVVAGQVGTPALILAAWSFGGLVALAGAFVYAELASLRPAVGGQYAYLREAYSPQVAFLYGWVLLLVTQSGGMAAVAVTLARYLGELVALPVSEAAVALAVLAALTAVNCLGVRAGSDVQSLLMVLKTIAILGLVATGFVMFGGERVALRARARPAAVARPRRRLRRGARAGAVRLRGLADLGLRDGGAEAAGAGHAARAAARRRGRRGALPLGQRRLPAGARRGRPRREPGPGLRRDARGARRARRPPDRARHRDLDARLPGPGHPDRAARLLRHGARRRLLPRGGPSFTRGAACRCWRSRSRAWSRA